METIKASIDVEDHIDTTAASAAQRAVTDDDVAAIRAG